MESRVRSHPAPFGPPAEDVELTAHFAKLGERGHELARRIKDGRLPEEQIGDYVHGMLLAAYMEGAKDRR